VVATSPLRRRWGNRAQRLGPRLAMNDEEAERGTTFCFRRGVEGVLPCMRLRRFKVVRLDTGRLSLRGRVAFPDSGPRCGYMFLALLEGDELARILRPDMSPRQAF
jgi:hypothetical protein